MPSTASPLRRGAVGGLILVATAGAAVYLRSRRPVEAPAIADPLAGLPEDVRRAIDEGIGAAPARGVEADEPVGWIAVMPLEGHPASSVDAVRAADPVDGELPATAPA